MSLFYDFNVYVYDYATLLISCYLGLERIQHMRSKTGPVQNTVEWWRLHKTDWRFKLTKLLKNLMRFREPFQTMCLYTSFFKVRTNCFLFYWIFSLLSLYLICKAHHYNVIANFIPGLVHCICSLFTVSLIHCQLHVFVSRLYSSKSTYINKTLKGQKRERSKSGYQTIYIFVGFCDLSR